MKKVRWIPSINAFAIQLFSNCSIHIANMFKQSFTFCLNTAAPIFMTTCCSLFPVCFFMASGVRAFSVRLIFSMICMTWSCSTLMHACKEPLSSVTLKCIVNLLKHTKYAFMLYVLSKCICYTMLWLSCFCDENSKQLSSNRSLLITSHTVLECLFNHCTHCGSNKCQKQANKQKT